MGETEHADGAGTKRSGEGGVASSLLVANDDVSADADRTSTSASSSKRPKKSSTSIDPALVASCEVASREERLRKNRQQARDRRNRKKTLIENMQRNVVVLSRMNADLRKKNQDLVAQLAQYGVAGHPGALEGIEASDAALAISNMISSGTTSLLPTPNPPAVDITASSSAVQSSGTNNAPTVPDASQLLANLNPMMLAGNPALLQVLSQQFQAQNLQARQQATDGLQEQPQTQIQPKPQSQQLQQNAAQQAPAHEDASLLDNGINQRIQQLQAQILALHNLQAAAPQQQFATIGGLNPAALASLQQGGQAAMGVGFPVAVGKSSGDHGLPGVAPNASRAATGEPSDPSRVVVVHHHHTATAPSRPQQEQQSGDSAAAVVAAPAPDPAQVNQTSMSQNELLAKILLLQQQSDAAAPPAPAKGGG